MNKEIKNLGLASCIILPLYSILNGFVSYVFGWFFLSLPNFGLAYIPLVNYFTIFNIPTIIASTVLLVHSILLIIFYVLQCKGNYNKVFNIFLLVFNTAYFLFVIVVFQRLSFAVVMIVATMYLSESYKKNKEKNNNLIIENESTFKMNEMYKEGKYE